MFSEVIDSSGEESDLHFAGARIAIVHPVFRDNRFFVDRNCHNFISVLPHTGAGGSELEVGLRWCPLSRGAD